MRVAILGATGTTGVLVVEEVIRRGLSCRALGRDPAALRALAVAGDVDKVTCDLASLTSSSAFAGVDVVINCAGPFSDTRRATEDAAMVAGIPVVHICGEPAQLSALVARDTALRDANITVVGGAGWATAVSELACWLAAKGLAPPFDLEIFHGAASSVPSVGSLQSYLAGVDSSVPGDDEIRVVELPAPLGSRAVRRTLLAEHVTLPRCFEGAIVSAYVDVGPPRTAALKPLAFLRDAAALRQMLAWREERGARGPDAAERAAMQVVLVASARSRAEGPRGGAVRRVELVGTDPYGLTALLAVQIAVDVVRSPKPGARAPLEVLDPQPALAALARAGVRWTVINNA